MKKFDDTEPAKSLVTYCFELKAGIALDMGCGKGKNALWLARNGWQVTAVDPREEYLETAKERAVEQGLAKVNFIRSDIENYHSTESYDLVVCAMVLHFLSEESIKSAIKKIESWTKIGGMVFISVMTDQNPSGTRPTLFKPGQLVSYFDGWELTKTFQIKTEPMLMPGKTRTNIFYFDYLIARKL